MDGKVYVPKEMFSQAERMNGVNGHSHAINGISTR